VFNAQQIESIEALDSVKVEPGDIKLIESAERTDEGHLLFEGSL
jgi:hypothetical protein